MATSNLNPEAKLYAVYNQKRIDQSLEPIIPAQFDMGPPEIYSGPRSTDNTRSRVVPKSTTASFGQLNMYYNRKDMATAFTTPLKVVKGGATTVHQLINEINEELGIESTTTDWLDGSLGGSNFNLTASPLNRVFTGGVLVGYYT